MIHVTISPELQQCCPSLALGIICCQIQNQPTSPELWQEIETTAQRLKTAYTLENIKTQPQIFATREVYKKTGKDPNRYRPSSEALCRRILRDMPLYQISAVVDVINLISIETGFSIGGFDAAQVVGDVTAGIGNEAEPFEAIGRGLLNVAGLPILRDQIGAIGTPTSDVLRTSLQMNSQQLYMNINSYSGKSALLPAIDRSIFLLQKYVAASLIETIIVE
ncbi:MAG: phenylalanine--tRNA ligase beta subunit-related protein [Bacteroidales bacterium]|nr:phenylalanine--tRNA ligase beta subunit-related protein [Bacteroidales bacterium]